MGRLADLLAGIACLGVGTGCGEAQFGTAGQSDAGANRASGGRDNGSGGAKGTGGGGATAGSGTGGASAHGSGGTVGTGGTIGHGSGGVRASDASVAGATSLDAGLIDSTSAGDASTGCDDTAPFGEPILVPGGINSGDDDMGPRLSADERTMYFTRRPLSATPMPTDLYVATRPTPTASFDAAVPLSLNSPTNDGDAMVSLDGTNLIFSSDRPLGSGEFDLYLATSSGAGIPFVSAQPVGAVNSPGSEVEPFLASDGELWFSYRVAGFSTYLHLRRAPRVGATFGQPTAVPELESTTDEQWPVLSNDKRTIYFASSRPDGGAKGKADVWRARRGDAFSKFDAPENVQELNSAATDYPGWLSPDGCRLYLASNRGTSAGYDIYFASR